MCAKNKTVTTHQKQIPLKLEHAITMHNFQGSTLEYMKGDFDSISKNVKLNTVPISQGTMHVILSQATRRDKLHLVNFELEHIKVNSATLQEILRMREEALFSITFIIYLWDKRGFIRFAILKFPLKHLMSNSAFFRKFDIICFSGNCFFSSCTFTRI